MRFTPELCIIFVGKFVGEIGILGHVRETYFVQFEKTRRYFFAKRKLKKNISKPDFFSSQYSVVDVFNIRQAVIRKKLVSSANG